MFAPGMSNDSISFGLACGNGAASVWWLGEDFLSLLRALGRRSNCTRGDVKITAKVKVNMRLCGKTHHITVDSTEEGDFRCTIETDCINVKEFSQGVERLTIMDLTDKKASKIVNRYCDCGMSANCLVPAGVMSAGWMEAGMISRTLAGKKKANDVEFIVD